MLIINFIAFGELDADGGAEERSESESEPGMLCCRSVDGSGGRWMGKEFRGESN